MKRSALIRLTFASLALPVAHSARAAAIIFTNRPAFLGGVVNAITFDFDVASGFPAAPASLSSFAGGSVLVTTDGGDSAAAVQSFSFGFGQAIGGQSGGNVDNGLAVRLLLTGQRFAVGFDDLDLTPGEFAIINVAFGNGVPSQRFSITDPDGDFATPGFFGITSSDPIASIQVYSADATNDPPGARANLIDNVTLAEVPEPCAYVMVVAGGLALLMARKRRP